MLRDHDLSKEIRVDICNLGNEIYQNNLIVAKYYELIYRT